MSDYNITLFEACEQLSRSKKSISRYVRKGLLHPKKVKSQQGTLEYRFSESELKAFKEKEPETRQDRQDTQDRTDETQKEKVSSPPLKENKESVLDKSETGETGHGRQDGTGQDGEIITLLKETTGLLRDQLKVKDEQIKGLGGKIDQLIERDRETNILLKGLQEKVLILEQPKPEQTGQDKENKEGFLKRLFNGKL